MATNIWQGGAAAIAQVDTITPGGTIEATDLFIITINGKSLSVVSGGTSVADVTAAVTTAFNASTEPEFAEITAGDATTHVTLTADTPGVPFTVTVSTTETGDGAADEQTWTLLSDGTGASVLNSGPNDANVVTNWSDDSLPAADDDVVFENSSVSCLYNLDVTAALTFTVKASFTGQIGLPRNNAHGYVEYRTTGFTLGTAVTDIDIGQGEGLGSSRINLIVGDLTAALDITVDKTGSREVTGIPPLLITTGSQSNDTTLTVNRGDIGVAFYAGETAVIDTIKMGYITQQATDAKVTCSDGVTLTTVTKSGGILYCDSLVTLTQSVGTTTISEDATLTTAIINGGTLHYNSTGTLGAVHVTGGGVLDLRQDGRARTISAAVIYKGGTIHDPCKTVTWTAGIDLYYCSLDDVTLDIGEHVTIGLTSV